MTNPEKKSPLKERASKAVAVSLAVLSGASVLAGCGDGVNTTERIVTICDKERVQTGSGDSQSSEYRVYTADSTGKSHTYRVVDTLIIGGLRQNSADTYGDLDEGTTFMVKSSGYRQGFLSMFPNIIEAKEQATSHPEWC